MQNTPYQPGGTLSTGHYEFNETENATIADAGARAKLWGVASFITGALALVGLIVALLFKDELIQHGLESNYITIFVVTLVPVVLTHLVISMLYIGAGKSLQAVVHTQGNDIEHLMQSINKLGTAFLVEFAIGMIAIIGGAYVGVQMAVDNLAAQKAAEAERAALAAAAIEDATEDEETDGEDVDEAAEGSGGEAEGDEAEDAEDAEASDTDNAEAAEGSGGAAEEAEAEADGEEADAIEVDDADEAEAAPADPAVAPPTEPAAG